MEGIKIENAEILEILNEINEKLRVIEGQRFIDYNCCFRGQKSKCPCNRGCRLINACIFNTNEICPRDYKYKCLGCSAYPVR